MSTDQQQPQQAAQQPAHPQQGKQEPNPVAAGLSNAWDAFKSGRVISYPIMGLILLVVVGGVIGGWIWWESKKSNSARWKDYDAARTPERRAELIKKYPGTTQARLATLDDAREQLGPMGLDQLANPDPVAREAAIGNVEKCRESFAKLADEFKDDPIIRAECLYSMAVAESSLVGMPRPGSEQSRGDKTKAIEYCNKVVEAAPDTDWAARATKLVAALQSDELGRLHTAVFRAEGGPVPPFQPKLPPGHPAIPPIGPGPRP